MKILRKGEILIQNTKIILPYLTKPDTSEFGRNFFQVLMVFEKGDNELKELEKLLKFKVKEAKIKIKDPKNYPIRDGDSKYQEKLEEIEEEGLNKEDEASKKANIESYKNTFSCKISSKFKPEVYNAQRRLLTDEEVDNMNLNGAICNIQSSITVYKKSKKCPNSGVRVNLLRIQVLEEGGTLKSSTAAEDVFDVCESKMPEETADKKETNDFLDFKE